VSHSCSASYSFSLFPALLTVFLFPHFSLYTIALLISFLLLYRLGYGVDGLGLESCLGQEIFIFSITSRPALGPTQCLVQLVPGLFPGDRAAGLEVDHSSPIVEVKNEWSYTTAPPVCFHGGDTGKFCLFYFYSSCPSPYSPFHIPARPSDFSCVSSRKCALSN
jgi:hypothetical protein